MALIRYASAAALALIVGSGSAFAAACKGDWMLATENGTVYRGSAIHQGNKIVFLGEQQNTTAASVLHLSGLVQSGTNQVVFVNADREGQLFAAEIGEGCNIIRGFAQSEGSQVFFTMTKMTVEASAEPSNDLAAAPADPAQEFASIEDAQSGMAPAPVATTRTAPPPVQEKKGFFRRLFSSDDDEPKKEKKKVLIHRDRLNKNF